MMYERPPTTPFQNPPRNTTFPFQRFTLVFQQHQDEPIYDVWTCFKNLIKIVPHLGLDLWSPTQFFYDHVDNYTRMDLDFTADGNLRELSANLKLKQKRLFGNEDVWVKMLGGIAWVGGKFGSIKVPTQVLLSFEEYTPPVTCPKEVEETLGTPVEVEPLDETQLEDLGLNTCNHDIPLSNREVPSFDEPEPQPNPLPNCVDISNWEMFDDDWGLESKEVSPLGKELSLFDRPNEEERGRILEAHRLEHIIQQPIFQHVTPSHNDGRKAYLLEDKQIPSVGVFDEVYFSFGRHLEELHVTWAHLEKKRTRLRTYTNIDQEFLYSGWRRRHRYNVTPSPRRSRRRHMIP
ncbi:hypothetical protein Tco_0540804 [Tanacetum coccineum]